MNNTERRTNNGKEGETSQVETSEWKNRWYTGRLFGMNGLK
jgi:hypothetical protein